MVAASTHHVVRVTVRISAAPFYRSVDVSLPTTSTFSEVLPELARLIELPQTGRPWEFATAAGAPLDPHIPLHNMRLRDGQVLALRPHEQVEPPVVRDAAESLAATAAAATHSGIDTAATFAGAAAAGLLAASLSTPLAGAAVTALILLVVAAAARSRTVFPAAALAASGTCGAWVAGVGTDGGPAWPPATDLAVGAVTTAVVAAALIAGGAVLGLAGPRFTSAVLASAVMGVAGASAVWLPAPEAPAAAVVLAGIVTVMLTPSAATRAAGLRIPRVPTAGQEFGIADDHQDDVDARAAAARAITAGISSAVAVCVVPALAVLARTGGGWVFALCMCASGALIVHASRHHDTVPRLSLGGTAVMALACGAAAVAAAARTGDAHPVLLIAAGLAALAAATAALWASRVPDLEPTTLVWLERAEAAAIIAVIPLAVKLTGIFDLIRGL